MTLSQTPLEMVWDTYTATRDYISLAERLGWERLDIYAGTNFIGLSSLAYQILSRIMETIRTIG